MIRTRILSALAITLTATACASPGPRPLAVPLAVPQSANPSGVIAAEIAFNRLAQEKGFIAAQQETAAKDAVVFIPEPILLSEARKQGKLDNSTPKWQPHTAFMSCDGKTGVTTGAWQMADGSTGYFTTAWQWFDKGKLPPNAPPGLMLDGEWKWVVDHGAPLSSPRAAPEFIETKVASCKGQPNAPLSAPPMGAKMKMGLSRDQSLNFSWVVLPDNSRTFEVRLWNGSGFDTVLTDRVAAPAQ